MPVGYIALIFGIFGLIAAYTIQNDIKRGVTWDQWTFALDQNPIMFSVAILGKASIVVLAIAEILHAFGLVGDPIAARTRNDNNVITGTDGHGVSPIPIFMAIAGSACGMSPIAA